jgi:hypothetical protein
MLKRIGTALCLIVLCVLAAPKARANDFDHKTTLTFSAPFEVPGVGQHMFPAGTYVFKLVDVSSNRHIVQILSSDETHVYTTILAIPNLRLKTTGKTLMTFREQPAGEPEALRAWFYPGHEWGEHFVYGKSRATELAKESNEAVLAVPDESATAPVESLSTASVTAITPSGETVDTAQVVEAPPVVAPAAAIAPAPVEMASLPKTASYLPLIGLLGLLMLGGGLGLTGILKRSA